MSRRRVERRGISAATYYNWRKKFGGMGRSQLGEMKALEMENRRLKKIVAEFEPDKLILIDLDGEPGFSKAQGLTADDLRQAIVITRQKLGTAGTASAHSFRQ